MGQPITVLSTTVEAGVVAFHTDRAITGQDGARFSSGDDAAEAGTIPGALASKLFTADEAINHVFIASNQVDGTGIISRCSGFGASLQVAVLMSRPLSPTHDIGAPKVSNKPR